MTKPPSKVKLKNFRSKIKDISDQESELRARARSLYTQLVLDVGDSEIALRYVRLSFFEIQKYRFLQQLKEDLEFHPFFGCHIQNSMFFKEMEEDSDEDDII